MRVRVLVVNTVYTGQNGITNVIFHFYEAMDKSNMQIDILSINQPEQSYVDIVEKAGGNLLVVPDRLKSPLAYAIRYIRIVKEYDIVHVHGNSATMALELFLAKLAGVKVRIAHSHNTTCKHKVLDKILRPLFKISYTEAFACSDMAGKWLFGNQKYRVLKNAFQVEEFQFDPVIRGRYRKELGLGDRTVLGHVGLFNEQKNHEFLIRIFAEYKKREKEAVLLLIGAGALKDRIKELVSGMGLEGSVKFLGVRSDVNRLMNAFDYFVFPSRYEGLGIALLEAQANGLPVFASAGVIPESVKVTDNFVFLPLEKSAAFWAERIGKTEAKRNPSGNKEICKAGYSIDREAERLRRLYQRFMRKPI